MGRGAAGGAGRAQGQAVDRDQDRQRRQEDPARPQPGDPPGIQPEEERDGERPLDASFLAASVASDYSQGRPGSLEQRAPEQVPSSVPSLSRRPAGRGPVRLMPPWGRGRPGPAPNVLVQLGAAVLAHSAVMPCTVPLPGVLYSAASLYVCKVRLYFPCSGLAGTSYPHQSTKSALPLLSSISTVTTVTKVTFLHFFYGYCAPSLWSPSHRRSSGT